MAKIVIIYNLFFIGLLLVIGLILSTENSLHRNDRRLRVGQPFPIQSPKPNQRFSPAPDFPPPPPTTLH
ncbi:hypothetical protein CDL12_16125 [Handroanthus impetiginosus]|uniref:Transmembrane protein n=1 Tax=Handroanthus impetiginosus TaxID=429701 RepID=A0A2G9H188_9LAMI|nr:hypothetical protein CDL12_16125 [Handroanthus impetiginosus]